jgi:two-component system, OmpR family, heavy metal sensor histidine kinase CusS
MTGTLRFRLTFWNTVGLLLFGAATLVGLRAGLGLTLSRELARLTAEDAAEVILAVDRATPTQPALAGFLDRKAQSHSDRDWFGQVLGPDGAVIAASESAPALPWPADPPPGPFDLGGYRVLEESVPRPDGAPLTIRVGSSLRVLVLAGAAILVVAPAVGYWLAGRATAPLRAIIATAERLRPDALAERLPLRGTGDELDQLSGTINGFLDRLADHLGRQREFVANAAHELRSPLAALRAGAEVALQRDRTPAAYQDLLADLVGEADALSRLVNQLLLLAEGDADRLKPGAGVVPLADQAARAVDMFHEVAEQRGVTLALDRAEAVAVRGDAAHVRQVIHNLLDNAIKFTPPGGRVAVAVGPAADGRAELRVADTGIGIAPADLPHVFDRFFRADRARPRDGAARGTGLGLSICQAVVAAYGGRIAVDSAPGRGTTVTVDLPRAE